MTGFCEPITRLECKHYTTTRNQFLEDPCSGDVGISDLSLLFQPGEGSWSLRGDTYAVDPIISLLLASETPKAKDPTVFSKPQEEVQSCLPLNPSQDRSGL